MAIMAPNVPALKKSWFMHELIPNGYDMLQVNGTNFTSD